MTTSYVAAVYLDEHQQKINRRSTEDQQKIAGKGYAVFNPHGRDEASLPVIYGFNNGGQRGWLSGVLLAEDGTCFGEHVCSDEGYMLHDLGVLDGVRPDRHETFRAHYPDGYRMDFVSGSEALSHPGLKAAYEANQRAAAP